MTARHSFSKTSQSPTPKLSKATPIRIVRRTGSRETRAHDKDDNDMCSAKAKTSQNTGNESGKGHANAAQERFKGRKSGDKRLTNRGVLKYCIDEPLLGFPC
jgi:hypothetical protein